MANNVGKKGAVAGAAVVALGGVTHFSGVLSKGGDDAVRSVARAGDQVVPPPRFPTRPPPEIPVGGSTAESLVREGQSDDVAVDVICFAYDAFYDATTGSLSLPTQDEFAFSVAEAVVPGNSQLAYRLKAQSLYSALNAPDVDIDAVVGELAC